MLQMARQLTDTVDGILLGKRHLILDRDTKYCQVFRDFVKSRRHRPEASRSMRFSAFR